MSIAPPVVCQQRLGKLGKVLRGLGHKRRISEYWIEVDVV